MADTAGAENSLTIPKPAFAQVFRAPGSAWLHTAAAGPASRQSLLFTAPADYIAAHDAGTLHQAFAAADAALAAGYYLAGYVTYEAGLLLHGLAAHPLPSGEPLLCFGVYRDVNRFAADLPTSVAAQQTPRLHLAPLPALTRQQYDRHFAQLQHWIAAGDIYQANYTFPLQSLTDETAETLFHALLEQQPAEYSAVLRLSPPGLLSPTLLSFSPELFFRTGGDGTILTRPMKGTAQRALDPSADTANAAWLNADPKNRAEHVMIVDLLRNDLGRVCETGTVHTRDLFSIQSLPTVHQMVSDVHGRLRPGTSWLQIFQALFPSGSITGAPKIRAMQRLHQVENARRGVYTGAIGYIAPSGEACFSVAIRTLTLRPRSGAQEITCGVGGGIVADSTPAGEYNEALLKAAYLRRAAQPIEIIETMRSDGGEVRWLEPHLDRLEQTTQALAIDLSRSQTRDFIQEAAAAVTAEGPQRLRVTLTDASPHLHVRVEPLQTWPARLRVRLAQHRTHLGDPALVHKTNFREHYDFELEAARRAAFDEAIFANDAGLVTEGCLTTLFFVRSGRVFTPYLEGGALPGVLRGQLLQHKLIQESLLPLADLASVEALLLGNSLRGIFPVVSLQLGPQEEIRWLPDSFEPHLQRLRAAFPAAMA